VIWCFGDCELDEERYEVRRRGRPVRLEPRVFDVLHHLLRHRERVVAKAELLDALWPGLAVSDSVLPRAVAAARRAVGRRTIQTVHGRGYRFVAKAEVSEGTRGAGAEASGETAPESLFVGRAEAMAELRRALAAAAAGRGALVLLVGEPGIGKTRTLEELAGEARRAGFRWLAGRSVEAEGAPAFWPFVQILRALAAAGRHPAVDLFSGLAESGAGGSRLGSAEGEQARFRLFDSVAEELRREAGRGPLLVSVDDLHWADGDSLRLFRFLAGELRDAPLLLVGTYRDVEVRRGHPLARTLGDLAREPRAVRVALRGLAPDEVGLLVGSVAGAAPAPSLVAALADLTDGNPFFVREMARWLRDEHVPLAGSASALALPQGVRDALGRRLDALSAPCNELLRVAAVIGREFGAQILADVSETPREALLERLAEAFAAGVVVEEGEAPGRYAFAHALVRQTLYEEIPAPRRALLHRRAGEALREASRHLPRPPVSELAHHFYEALPSGPAEEAIHFCVAAAEAAHEQLAYDESARHYERAVEALDFARPADERRRAELLVALGEERWTAGEREAGRARLAEAADLARSLGQPDLLARAAIAYRGFGEMGMPPDAKTLGLLEEARDGLGEGHPVLRARLLSRLAGTPPYSLSMARRRELAREAARLAAGTEDPAALVDAIGARYWASLGPERIEERLAVARDALEFGARTGDRRLALLGHEIALAAHLLRGEVAEADREIGEYERKAEEIRQPVFRFLAGMIRGSRAISAGDFEGAEDWMRVALERGRGTVPFAELVVMGQRVFLMHLRGELEQVAELVLEVGSLLDSGFGGTLALTRAVEVAALARVGRGDEARERYEELAARDFAELERDENWLLTLQLLSELVSELGDRRRGELLYAWLAPHAGLMVSHDLIRVVTGSVEGVLGRLALLAGRSDAAIAHYERAIRRDAAAGLAPGLGLAQVGLARALLARGGRAGSERAQELLADVLSGGPNLARRHARELATTRGLASAVRAPGA
jgi:DNA-binding winged helix-turn-helix (wHTH) protein/tetratricopeptide (TPR) repeat protein